MNFFSQFEQLIKKKKSDCSRTGFFLNLPVKFKIRKFRELVKSQDELIRFKQNLIMTSSFQVYYEFEAESTEFYSWFCNTLM